MNRTQDGRRYGEAFDLASKIVIAKPDESSIETRHRYEADFCARLSALSLIGTGHKADVDLDTRDASSLSVHRSFSSHNEAIAAHTQAAGPVVPGIVLVDHSTRAAQILLQQLQDPKSNAGPFLSAVRANWFLPVPLDQEIRTDVRMTSIEHGSVEFAASVLYRQRKAATIRGAMSFAAATQPSHLAVPNVFLIEQAAQGALALARESQLLVDNTLPRLANVRARWEAQASIGSEVTSLVRLRPGPTGFSTFEAKMFEGSRKIARVRGMVSFISGSRTDA